MDDKSLDDKKIILEDLEEKSLLYRLKRWEKELLKKLKKFFYKDKVMKEHIKVMEDQKKYYNEEIKKENENYEKISKEIEENKKKEINLIEDNKNKIIQEKNKKYNDLIIYLESIKNDKNKLIDFFNNYTNLF